MKLATKITIALLPPLTLAAKYPPGTACRTNTECNDNCIDKQWTIANRNDVYIFVCDPSLTDPTGYFVGQCRSHALGLPLSPLVYNVEKTASACSDVGGQFCDEGCVITGKESTATEARSTWLEACSHYGTEGTGQNKASRGEAVSLAACAG
jgi:hypothetical protein